MYSKRTTGYLFVPKKSTFFPRKTNNNLFLRIIDGATCLSNQEWILNITVIRNMRRHPLRHPHLPNTTCLCWGRAATGAEKPQNGANIINLLGSYMFWAVLGLKTLGAMGSERSSSFSGTSPSGLVDSSPDQRAGLFLGPKNQHWPYKRGNAASLFGHLSPLTAMRMSSFDALWASLLFIYILYIVYNFNF